MCADAVFCAIVLSMRIPKEIPERKQQVTAFLKASKREALDRLAADSGVTRGAALAYAVDLMLEKHEADLAAEARRARRENRQAAAVAAGPPPA